MKTRFHFRASDGHIKFSIENLIPIVLQLFSIPIFSFQCSSGRIHMNFFGHLAQTFTVAQVHLDFLRRRPSRKSRRTPLHFPCRDLICRNSSELQTSHQERWSREYIERAILRQATAADSDYPFRVRGSWNPASPPSMYTFPVIESLPGGLDRGPDVVATEEEVRAIFDKLASDKTFSETRKLGDETGLFLWDVEIPTEDGKTEYSFRRGRAEAGELPGIRIDMAYYDVSGTPISGHSVAKRIKRIWSLTP